MPRAIQPFYTMYNGDVLYMVTTNSVKDKQIDPMSLGIFASEVAWDAFFLHLINE